MAGLIKAVFQDVTSAETTAKHELGDVYYSGKGKYVYAYNADTTALNLGLGVVHASGASSWSVLLSAATGVHYCGHVEGQTVPTGTYFWLFREGIASSVAISGVSAEANNVLFPAAAGGFTATAPSGSTGMSGYSYWGNSVGYAVNTIAGDATGGEAMLRY